MGRFDAVKRGEALQQLSRDQHGALHFRVEEDVMLPWSARHLDPRDPAVHVEIRRRANELTGDEHPDPAELNALRETLNDHVRHEERVLFPMIEEALPADELARLAQRIDEAEFPA